MTTVDAPAERSTARLGMALLAALTLGLAPFVPEPHVIGKLRWVLGGAAGMTPMDALDLALHGAPWLWFLAELGRFSWLRRSGGRSESG